MARVYRGAAAPMEALWCSCSRLMGERSPVVLTTPAPVSSGSCVRDRASPAAISANVDSARSV